MVARNSAADVTLFSLINRTLPDLSINKDMGQAEKPCSLLIAIYTIRMSLHGRVINSHPIKYSLLIFLLESVMRIFNHK